MQVASTSHDQNSFTVGPRGPLLVQDHRLFEKHTHFNRERILDRVVHAKGAAAFGTLTITHDISRYTREGVHAGQPDPTSGAFFHRRGRARCSRRRARYARLRPEVLNQRRQLGSGRQQHADVFRARSVQVSGLHPYPETRSAREHAPQHDVRADHGRGRGREDAVRPFRPDQHLAARRTTR